MRTGNDRRAHTPCGLGGRTGPHAAVASPTTGRGSTSASYHDTNSVVMAHTMKRETVCTGRQVHRTGETNTNRLAKSQQRAAHWRRSAAIIEVQRRERSFLQGASQFKRLLQVKHDDIVGSIKKGRQPLDREQYYERAHCTEERMKQAGEVEHREMNSLLEFLQEGGVGYLPGKKRDGWVRLMFENWNSLGIFTHSWKLDRLNYLIRHLQVDVVMGCESQCDWSYVDPHKQLMDVLCPEMEKKGTAAHNINERINREQMGGTAIAALGRLCDMVVEVGRDHSGLGRYSWIRLGNGKNHTRVVSGYVPCRPGRNSKGRTVWDQAVRYFQAIGDFRPPADILIDDLASLISGWRKDGDEVVLALDANQDVYSGKLARALSVGDADLSCLMEPVLGEQVPNSHFRGTGKISTIFGSPGLIQGHAMCSPHWYGIGDHRVFVLELSATSLYGGDLPAIPTPTARQLNCKISRVRLKYCATLTRLTERHKMGIKLQTIQSLRSWLPQSQIHYLHDRWDTELGEFMCSAEKTCTTMKSCLIEYSPTVGQWLRRRAIYKWILRWHEGKVPDTRNLERAARRSNIDKPLLLAREEIEWRLQGCLHELFRLKSQAPELRRKHLSWRLSLARKRGDELAEKEITRIIKTEASRKRQRRINHVVRDPSGRAIISVQTSIGSVEQTLTTRAQVEEICGNTLGQRFTLGTGAPLSAGTLAEVIGPLSDTEAAQQILANTYNFQSEWDEATVDLLRSAADIRLQMEDGSDSDLGITESEFISFWRTSKERTSSSKSGRHFGHYRAVCGDLNLVHLHTESINLAASMGRPLTRWRQGVTILLEKIAGNIHIDKLRAICLLEADFNWWLKAIFSKRMIHRMRSHNIMPIEQGATAGKTTTDSAMLKQLFFDQSNILHAMSAVSSNDAANCYDAVNHAAGSFALQAMHVPIQMIKCYLLCIQTMRFFLKTGFGLAETSYGGTKDKPYMGLTQGSGASPAAWTAISTLIVSAYKAKGHGACFLSAWSGIILVLTALLYVDDTDLLHLASFGQTDEDKFVERVRLATHYWAKLLQATGGNLKPPKCYWYLLSYRFKKGIASLKPLREIQHHSLSIPQPDHKEVEITLKDAYTSSEVLGIWSCPASTGTSHLEHMLKKGRKWSQRILSSSLSPAEVWHSFKTQALPAVSYGLTTLMVPRSRLDDEFGHWFYTFLPALGVSRAITKEWRTLPIQYQGLGLPLMSIEKLALSLQYLQRHWGTKSTYGQALRCSFELVQLETGLEGNFLLRNYNHLGCLATHSWFRVLWEYVHHYKVTLDLGEVKVPIVRRHDTVLMELIIKNFEPHQWESLNRARKFFKIYFVSQLLLGDGSTVNPEKLNPTHQASSTMLFPLEKPTAADFRLWREMVTFLTSPTLRWSPRLGAHQRLPFQPIIWWSNASGDYLIKQGSGQKSQQYSPVLRSHNTRGSKYYFKATEVNHTLPLTHIAFVKELSHDRVQLHSTSPLVLVESQPRDAGLKKCLESIRNEPLWCNLVLDGDGT